MREQITQRWEELEPLLDALLELPPQQQAEKLAQCADPHMRAALAELLAHDAGSGGSIDRIGQALGHGGVGIEGQHLGPYLIERQLGEGGMGAVFLAARQTAEFTQRVALKLLRSGVYSSAQQKLFQREQRIHARLQHAHIARVFDSGISAAGVPYFAMEFVDGPRITDYCDARRLSVDARLRLFATVCDAVAYAHQNLIVHRDLKPSNILVDANGEPKLLDFGIAKLLESDTGAPAPTGTAQAMLTPQYAAPEQFGRGTVTTATDVYALGMLLGELLTGKLPARETASITRCADAATAAARGVTLAVLRRQLHGDLDAIVHKALQTEPPRRYPGAADLAEDVRRFLDGKPIRARPDALAYRARKFVQRHKIGFAASLALAATLIGATAISMYEAAYARREATRATAEAERANAVKQFLLHLFYSSAPATSQRVETADDMLARGQQQSSQELASAPALRAEVLAAIGDIQRRRGKIELAGKTLAEADELARTAFAANNPQRLEIEALLARMSISNDRFADGLAALDAALASYRSAGGAEHIALAHALEYRGVLQMRLGHYPQAVAQIRDALALHRRLLPADDVDIDDVLSALAEAQGYNGDYAGAIATAGDLVARARGRYGKDHVQLAEAVSLLATPLRQSGRLDEAEAALQEAADIQRRAYAEPQQNLAITLNDLGVTQTMLGKHAAGAVNLSEALAIAQKVYKGDSLMTAIGMDNLGRLRHLQGNFADAEPLVRDALAMMIRIRGKDHPRVAQTEVDLAQSLIELRRFEEAAGLLDTALAVDRARFGDKHESIGSVMTAQARLALRQGNIDVAMALLAQADSQLDALPKSHARRTELHLLRAEALLAANRGEAALDEARSALDSAQHAATPLALTLVRAETLLAKAQLARGDPSAAQISAREARARLAAAPSSTPALRADLDDIEGRLAAAH